MVSMAALLFPLLILLSLLMSCKLLALGRETNQFIYNGFKGANVSLSGIANIQPNGLLELTNTSKQQIGYAFYPFPLTFNTSSSNNSRSLSFSTTFVFAMVPEARMRGGHGIAFVISPSVEFTGAIATQYFGLFNSTNIGLSSNHLFAVELDVVRNPEFHDINFDHVGVDVNNLTSIQSAPAAYFSQHDGENESLVLISGKPMQVWIEYDGTEKLVNVTLAPTGILKPVKPLLSTKIDLSSVLLDSMHVGFSSSTGSVSSNHYILGWSFNKSGQAQNLDISELPSLPHPSTSKTQLKLRIVIPLVAVVFLMIALSVTIFVMRKKYEEIREDWEQQYGPQRFSYRDLYKATNGFKDGGLLGSGGFGGVYKGVIRSSNQQIAVKKVSHDSKQGMKEFVAEIASMGRLRHRNLVPLLGYCRRKGELLLVYDYMPNGSLDKFLFDDEKPNLNWLQRYQIIRGVASALLYLHEEWEQVVLHRDIKASNVLLDAELNGKLGDFGLAKFHDHGSVPQTTNLVGTVGYLAPEITRTGRATTCSEVFAFGTFMLEVACGRKPVEFERSHEQVALVDWVFGCWKRGAILETVDHRLEGNYVEKEMKLILTLGLLSCQRIPAARPSMRQIVQYLDGNATLPEIPLHGPGIGLIPASNEASREYSLQFYTSEDNISINRFLDSDSILSSGR